MMLNHKLCVKKSLLFRFSQRIWTKMCVPLVISAMAVGVTCAAESNRMPSISAAQLHTFLAAKTPHLLLIDVGSPASFNAEHIPGAVNIPYEVLKQAEVDKNKHIVVYCAAEKCPMSTLAAKDLRDNGCKKVNVLRGGMSAWKKLYKTEGTNVPDAAAVKKAGFIFVDELASGLKSGIYSVIDTRPASEFRAAHIPEAQNMEPNRLFGYKSVEGVTPVICDSDFARGKQAVAALQRQNIAALELSGGIAAWARKKLPVAVGAK